MYRFNLLSFIACLLITLPVCVANEREQQISSDITSSQYADTYETLLAGEREMIVIINEATTPITRGVAVLVGEAGQNPLSHNNLAPLTRLLNQYGWVTMLVAAPATAFFEIPNPQESTSDEQQTINPMSGSAVLDQATFEQQETHLIQQLQTLAQRSGDYPGFLLVIAQGTSAAWISKIYSEQKLSSPDALVLISPYWPQREYNILLPDLVANTDMPLLDFYSRNDNKWAKATQSARKTEAEKVLKLHYRQRQVVGQAFDLQRYALISKDIYGWLTHMGW